MPPHQPLDLSTLQTLRHHLETHLTRSPTPNPPNPELIPLLSSPTLSIHAFKILREALQKDSTKARALELIRWGVRRCEVFSKVVRVRGGVGFLVEVGVVEGGLEAVREFGRVWGGEMGRFIVGKWGEEEEVVSGGGGEVGGKKRRGLKEMKQDFEGMVEDVEVILEELEAAYCLVPEGSVRVVEEFDGIAEVARGGLVVLKGRLETLEGFVGELSLLERASVDAMVRLRIREVKGKGVELIRKIEGVREKWMRLGVDAGRTRRKVNAEDMEDDEGESDEDDWEDAVLVTEPVASVIGGEKEGKVKEPRKDVNAFNEQLLRQLEGGRGDAQRRTRSRGRGTRGVAKKDRKSALTRLKSAMRRQKRAL